MALDNDNVRRATLVPKTPKKTQKTSKASSIKRRATGAFTTLEIKNYDVLGSVGQQIQTDYDDIYAKFDDATPLFARKENLKDSEQRSPSDAGYDCTSLYVPVAAWKQMTMAMKQFWQIKCKNFDKIIFFKMGKFYETFYDDALLVHKLLNLKFMGSKMHAGFPESAISRYGNLLVEMGYKVGVVDQVESIYNLKDRLQNSKVPSQKKEKIIKRELTKILTKGTQAIRPEANSITMRYFWSFYGEVEGTFSVIIAEISLGQTMFFDFENDEQDISFRHLLTQLPPTEVLYDPLVINDIYLQAFKKIVDKPVLTPVQARKDFWNPIVALESVKKRLNSTQQNGEEFENLEIIEEKQEEFMAYKAEIWKSLTTMIDSFQETSKERIQIVVAGIFHYFKKLKILENFLMTTDLIKTTKDQLQLRMKLDGFVLQHLELISESQTKTQKKKGGVNNLFQFLDRCSSPAGKRLLKSWICSPSLRIDEINSRLEAIEELNNQSRFVEEFKNSLEKEQDYERLLFKLSGYSLKRTSAVYYSDLTKKRLKELREFFEFLKKIQNILEKLKKNEPSSQKIMSLITFKEEGGQLPQIAENIQSIESCIVWTDNYTTPTPKEGMNPAFDTCKKERTKVIHELEQYLEKLKVDFGTDKVKYTNVKNKYEIELPDSICKKIKKNNLDFEYSSNRKGFTRYTSNFTRNKVEEIQRLEDSIREHLEEFCSHIFKFFIQNKYIWSKFIDIVKELDVLIAMSEISFKTGITMTRPNISLRGEGELPFIKMEGLVHPVLVDKVDHFVANDAYLGAEGIARCLLITGPNMGGKSTMLRQVALAVIMGQIGCYVAARECSFSLVDRIFTRLGATERIIIGKSTFQVEAEEALQFIKHGTIDSFGLIDELGRGTTHNEAVAYAQTYLEDITERMGCRCMFATHFHELLHMGMTNRALDFYNMDVDIDKEQEKIKFKYMFTRGVAQKSFALEVAEIASIPTDIIESSKEVMIPSNLIISEKTRQSINDEFDEISGLIKEQFSIEMKC